MNSAPFCTCDNYKCELNPVNHDQGCNLCMEKNLRKGVVPNCMFFAITKDKKPEGFTYVDFAHFVLDNTPCAGCAEGKQDGESSTDRSDIR